MSILYLTPGVFDKGGISRYNRFQIRALRERFGEESVDVCSLIGRAHDDFEDPFLVSFAGAVPLSAATRGLFALEVTRRALARRPRLVLSAHVNLGPLAYALCRLTGAGLAQNVYGHEIWGAEPLSWPRRQALVHSDVVIADCHNTADRAVELELVRNRPEMVWDCVDTERLSPGKPDWRALEEYGLRDNGRFKVLFLGRLKSNVRYKGYERLLEVVARLDPTRFEAVVAGKGDDLDHVRALAARLGIAERTTITGAIHEAHMADVYRSADAFYLASEVGPGMGEGIPLTPMEAMACGAPVLVGNQDGSRELLDERGGWCGAPRDLEAQCDYLAALQADAALHERERLAAGARARAVFGYERFARESVAAVENALR